VRHRSNNFPFPPQEIAGQMEFGFYVNVYLKTITLKDSLNVSFRKVMVRIVLKNNGDTKKREG